MGLDEVFRRYVPEYEIPSILIEAHGGAAGGNYVRGETVQNIV